MSFIFGSPVEVGIGSAWSEGGWLSCLETGFRVVVRAGLAGYPALGGGSRAGLVVPWFDLCLGAVGWALRDWRRWLALALLNLRLGGGWVRSVPQWRSIPLRSISLTGFAL